MPVSRTFLFFLVVVLQVILVEGKKGGKGKGKDSDVSDDGSGSRVGVIAGIVGGIVLVVISVGVKCRSWIQGLLKGSPNEQHGDKLSKANKLSKNSDLEGGNLKEYPPQDVPFYLPPPVQYNQMDWKREPGFLPPQPYPASPTFPPTPYTGGAYTPAQYSPPPPFPPPQFPTPSMTPPPVQPAYMQPPHMQPAHMQPANMQPVHMQPVHMQPAPDYRSMNGARDLESLERAFR